MTNIYARPTPLGNVCGRVDYISNPKRQEYLIATYSEVDKQYWTDLAAHCQKQAKEAGAKKVCEGREWHAALPNIYAEIYHGREEELAKMISEEIKAITGTDNIVALHWNKAMTNFHFHAVCSENKEINEISYGAVLTRNTYYDATGKRSNKKDCVDESGNLKKGCRLYKKGSQVETFKRFGPKEDLRDYEINRKIKESLAARFNKDLQVDNFRVYKDDGMHLKTQKIGKGMPEEKKKDIEERNKAVREWNAAIDEALDTGIKKSILSSVRKDITYKIKIKPVHAINYITEAQKWLRRLILRVWEEYTKTESKTAETPPGTSLDNMIGSAAARKKHLTDEELIDQVFKKMKKNKKYQKFVWLSLYHNDGSRRTLAEQLVILAAVVVTGEVPDWAKSEKQKKFEEREIEQSKKILRKYVQKKELEL